MPLFSRQFFSENIFKIQDIGPGKKEYHYDQTHVDNPLENKVGFEEKYQKFEKILTRKPVPDFGRHEPEDEQRGQVDVPHHRPPQRPAVLVLQIRGKKTFVVNFFAF
jgi:hypothetical protein